jgi:hypothetical protein
LVRAREACALSSNHQVRRAATGGFGATVPDGGIGFIPVGAHVDPIITGALNLEREVRRIDFELVFIIEMADAHDDRALGQLYLGGAIVEIQECDAGLRIHANRGRACLQFSPGILVSPQIVAGSQRTISDCLYPVALATGLKGNRSVRKTQARYSARRILSRLWRRALFLRRWWSLGQNYGRCL